MPFLFESLFFLVFVYFAIKIAIQVMLEKKQAPEVRLQRDWGDVEVLLRNQDYATALAELHARIHSGAGSLDIAYTLKARAQYGLQRYEQALRDSYRALSENLYYAPAYLEKLKALFILGEYTLALETCDYLHRLDPLLPEIYYYRAFIAEKLGDAPQADALYSQARQVHTLHR